MYYNKISEKFTDNDFYELIREIGGELIEKVELFDQFYNKKLQKESKAFRIYFRSFERTLKNEEIDHLQF